MSCRVILISVLILLLTWTMVMVQAYDYDHCFRFDKSKGELELTPSDPRAKPPDDPNGKEDYTYYSVLVDVKGTDPPEWIPQRQYMRPFSCHGAPCSIQNEAYWLGMYPFDTEVDVNPFKNETRKHFLLNKQWHTGEFLEITARRDWIFFMNKIWINLINMVDMEGKQIPDLERLPLPRYAKYLLYPDPSQHTERDKFRIVPLLCDPRSHLYCENNVQDMKAQKFGGVAGEQPIPIDPELSGVYFHPVCKCHPLYSDDSELEQLIISPAPDDPNYKAEIVNVCLGKANTPCQFGRRIPFEAVDQDTVDRDGTFMQPRYMDDFHNRTSAPPPESRQRPVRPVQPRPRTTTTAPLTKQDWLDFVVQSESKCIRDAACLPFPPKGPDEQVSMEDQYRNRTIFHGFGYNPILVDMMLLSVTKICLCNKGFTANAVHECVPE